MFKAYDYPTRIFHWLFASLFVTSFVIAEFVDDESKLYAYHMLSGLIMSGLVLWRVIWGFMGAKTARYSSFKLRPQELIEYFKNLRKEGGKRYLGHNPASSYSALMMMTFALVSGASGILSAIDVSHFIEEIAEEIHETSAKLFLITAIFHILGVVYHHFKYKDGLLTSMLTGKKKAIENEQQISSHHPRAAFILVVLFALGSFALLNKYDTSTGVLNLFGLEMELGEEEAYR